MLEYLERMCAARELQRLGDDELLRRPTIGVAATNEGDRQSLGVGFGIGPGEPTAPAAADPPGQQLGPATYPEVRVNHLRVPVDRMAGQPQASRDLLVAIPLQETPEHLSTARRKGRR